MKIAPNKNSKNSKNEQGKKVNKTKLAKNLGMCRQSLYYKPKLPAKDLELKKQIEEVSQTESRALRHVFSFIYRRNDASCGD